MPAPECRPEPSDDNSAERLAQADRVIARELKQRSPAAHAAPSAPRHLCYPGSSSGGSRCGDTIDGVAPGVPRSRSATSSPGRDAAIASAYAAGVNDTNVVLQRGHQ